MNLKLITNLKFADKLNSTNAVSESGKEMLKNYKGYLFSNEVTYGLVNGFIREASQYSFDTGMMSILESVLKYVNENKISWKLASACESVLNNKSQYNYIARLGVSQVDNLLDMNESQVVQYIKAGALKNIQYIPEFRNICKEVYSTNVIPETRTQAYSLTNPISYVVVQEGATIFSIFNRTFKVSEGKVEEFKYEDPTFNHINSMLPSMKQIEEGLEYTWKTGINSENTTVKLAESYILFKKGNIEEIFESSAAFREFADTYSRTMSIQERKNFLNACYNLGTIFEGMAQIVEVDNSKILECADGSIFSLVESDNNVNLTVFRNSKVAPSSTNYEYMSEALAEVKNLTGIDLKSVYETRLNEDVKKQDPESYKSIQEQLEAAKESKIEIRRHKIEMLAEQFKNDPIRIALLNAAARELAILEN